MKRRIFSLLLAVIMTVTTVDMTAFAKEANQKEMETVVEEETSVETESTEEVSGEEESVAETTVEETAVETEEETTVVSEETEEETSEVYEAEVEYDFDYMPTYYGNCSSKQNIYKIGDYGWYEDNKAGCYVYSYAMLLKNFGVNVLPINVKETCTDANGSYLGDPRLEQVYGVKVGESIALNGNKIEQLKEALDKYPRGVICFRPGHCVYAYKQNNEIYFHDPYSIFEGKGISPYKYVPSNNGYNINSYTSCKGLVGGSSTGSLPRLTVDSCTGGNKSITVRGWAFDYDDVNTPVTIHVYVGGPAGNGRAAVASFLANKEGTDIPKYYPGVGNYHRFEKTISVNVTGNQPVYVYALNLGGPDGFTEVACSAHIFNLPNATNSVANGNYHILSVVDPRYRVDVPGVGNPASGTKVSLHEAYPELNEAFTFTYNGDGTYRITKGNTSLDVTGASSVAGTPIQMHDNNASEAQKWILDPQNKTDYNFVSVCNGYNMDLNAGIIKEGGEITSYPRGLGDNQKWRLLPEGKRTIADGKYYIQSAKNHEYGLYVTEKKSGGNVILKKTPEKVGTEIYNAVFNVKYLGNEYYEITSDNYSLNVQGPSIAAGANAQIYSKNNHDSQRWVIKSEGNGYYSIINKYNALYLDLTNDKVVDGANIQMCYRTTAKGQQWKFVPFLEEEIVKNPSLEEDNSQISKYFYETIDDELSGSYFVRGCKVYNPKGGLIEELGMELWDGTRTQCLGRATEDKSAGLVGSRSKTGWFYEGVNRPSPGMNNTINYPLMPQKTYQYRYFIKVDGVTYYSAKWYVVTMKGVIQPPAPSLFVDKTDVKVNDTVTVSWNSVSTALGYTVQLDYLGETPYSRTVECDRNTTSVSFTLPYKGKYNVTAYSKGRQDSEVVSLESGVEAHDPSKVVFVMEDDDGNIVELYRKDVPYGESVSVEAPSKRGHSFQGWDSSLTNIKEDKVITALFKKNKYTVTFMNADKKEVLGKVTVEYKDAATPPESPLPPETGYVFAGWSSNAYECVTENTTVYASFVWENENLPILLENVTCQYEDEGYMMRYDIKNYDQARTPGRAIVSLKTETNKLLATTESSAFSLAASATKTGMEVFVPYEGVATKAELVIVNSFGDEIPISASTTVDVTREWSEWSETVPEGKENVETRIEYSYRDKETKTSSASSMSGWTKYDTTYTWSDYGAWVDSKTVPVTASESRQVEVRQVSDNNSYEEEVYFYYKRPGALDFCPWDGGGWEYREYTWRSNDGSVRPKQWRVEEGQMSYAMDPGNFSWGVYYNWELWWMKSQRTVPATTHKEYRYRDRSKIYTYHYYKWTDWSGYSPEPVTASDSKEVRTRTVYRYKDEITGDTDTTGTPITISGNVAPEFAGKQAMLIVYKGDEPSDYNNEYVSQTVIGENGYFEFTFITREEPSVRTGDFTVDLSIEGATSPIYLKTIEAPKPTYTVRFIDHDGTVIGEPQVVSEGGNVVLPQDPVRENYTFIGWDTPVSNIQMDTDITAIYVKNTYVVTFIDWKNKLVQSVPYEYGDTLMLPEAVEVEGYELTGWFDEEGNLVENETVVDHTMVLNAEYEILEYTVNVYDADHELVSTQQVLYGEAAELGETPLKEGMVFKGWNTQEYAFVKSDLDIYPIFEYIETAKTPVADVESGNLESAVTVHLTAESGATIFYTVDGTMPTQHSKVYEDGILINKNTVLRYIAFAEGKNISPSGISTYLLIDAEDTEGGLSIKKSSYDVELGDTFEISYFVSEGYTEDMIVFYSLDEKVAVVNDDGSITAVGEGNTKILALTSDEIINEEEPDLTTYEYKYGDFCEVNVTSSVIPVTSIKTETQMFAMQPGEKLDVEVTVYPENATYKDVTWHSDDNSVVRVDEDGTLQAVDYGTTVLRVYSNNGNYRLTCYAEVLNPYVEIDTDAFAVKTNGQRKLVGTVHGNITANVIWYSEDPNIATVDETGIVTGISQGTTKIHFASEDGIYDASAIVVVENADVNDKVELSSDDIQVVPEVHFTGSEIRPDVKVVHDGVLLLEDVDYSLVYANNVKIGTATVTAVGIGDYKGIVSKDFNIISANDPIVTGMKIAAIPDQVYTGYAIKPELFIYDGERVLENNVDYKLSYKNNTNVSTDTKMATVTITGKGQYTKKHTVTFRIVEKNISDGDISYTYDNVVAASSKGASPLPTITFGKKKLKKNTDFSVAYQYENSDSTVSKVDKAGKVKMIITGNGNYTGVTEKEFVVTEKLLLSKATVTLSDKSLQYTGGELKPTVTVKMKVDGKNQVVPDTAYTVEYVDNTEVGTATVTISATEDSQYAGSKVATFKITGIKMSTATMLGIADCQYDGTEKEQNNLEVYYNGTKINPYDGNNGEYIISYKNNINAGTATVTITGKGRFTGSLSKKFKINPVNMMIQNSKNPDITVSCTETATYDPSGAKPNITVTYTRKDLPALVLENGKDYTVSYSNNKKLGTAGIAITGKGNYKGKISNASTYTVTAKDISDSTVSIIATDAIYKEGTKDYLPSVTIKDGNKKLKSGKDYTISNATAKGISGVQDVTYTVDITGIGLYSGTAKVSYRVAENNISKASVKFNQKIYYTGEDICPDYDDITVKCKVGNATIELDSDDYEIVSYEKNVNVGTAKMVIVGKGKFGGRKEITFKILPRWFKNFKLFN